VSAPIESYALVGDCRTAALVGLDGSIDWLCWPRFDSDACFAALLGTPEYGRWLISPTEPAAVSRRYRKHTLILETSFATGSGKVTLIDFMVPQGGGSHLVRLLRGDEGEVELCMELILRFGYGATIPWVTRGKDGALCAVAGPDMTVLRTPVELRGEEFKTVAAFTVTRGTVVPFVLSYGPSHLSGPPAIDAQQALDSCESFWREWSAQATVFPPYDEAVMRSLITLKALTYAPSGSIVAAPTASLPESIGGMRNWDYRYCWIRDSTFTLLALMDAGFYGEAAAWPRPRADGPCSSRWSVTSPANGASRTAGSGSRAVRRAISSFRRSWPGSLSTALSEPSSAMGCRVTFGNGAAFVTRYMTRCGPTDLTAAPTRSGRPTNRRLATQASCCSLRSDSSMVPIRGSRARWRPSSASLWSMDS